MKPNIVDKDIKKNVVHVVDGRTHHLKLDWHVLRNAGQAGLQKPIAELQAIGKGFFDQEAPWKGLAKDKVRIKSFQIRLQEIFADDTRCEFPQVRSPAHLNNDTYETGQN